MGPLNASPIDNQSLLIWRPAPQTAAAKAGAPDLCTRSFYRDIGDLEQARGREQGGVYRLPWFLERISVSP